MEYNATLCARRLLTDDVAVFTIRPDEPAAGVGRWFVPGQYVTLGLYPQEDADIVRRPMTLVSSAYVRDSVEFLLNRVEQPKSDVPFSHLLWQLQPGQRLHMRMHPAGRFTVRDTVGDKDTRLRVCIGQGTGVAPFVSMIRTAIVETATCNSYVLVHGAQVPSALGFYEELTSYAQKGLRYVATVKRADSSWGGLSGAVWELMGEQRIDSLERMLGISPGDFCPAKVVVYICGLKKVIAEGARRLLFRGFVPNHRKVRRALEVPQTEPSSLFFEQYDAGPVFETHNPVTMQKWRTLLRLG